MTGFLKDYMAGCISKSYFKLHCEYNFCQIIFVLIFTIKRSDRLDWTGQLF